MSTVSQSEVIMTWCCCLPPGEGRGICRNKYEYLETILTSSGASCVHDITSSDEELPTSSPQCEWSAHSVQQSSRMSCCRPKTETQII